MDERERAARHDRWVEPEQRLVARQLAKEWEEKRTAQRRRQADDQRCVQTPSQPLSRTERAAIEPLAQNIPALWHAPTTTVADQQELVRQIIQRVMVRAAGRSDRLPLTIVWVGGGTTAGITTRPTSRTEHVRDDPRRCARMRTLAAAGDSPVTSTVGLAQEGCRSPTQDRPLHRHTVSELMRRLGVHQPRRRPCPPLGQQEWRLSA